MTRRWALALIALNLCALIGLIFVYPHMMVAPGPLIPAHAKITNNCFACHAPFRGASAERCTACHKVADIGIRSTSGAPRPPARRGIAFHQSLAQPNCLACHSDHREPRLTRAAGPTFAHTLLRSDVRNRCEACHRAPVTALHRQVGESCAQCHTTAGWKPATFDHGRFFALSGPHNASCTTCHVGGNLARYTCFGCHAHQPGAISARHAEEGITNIANCARCHRSGAGEEGGEGGEGGQRREGGGDD
jgi:hypothetical protein